MTKSEIIDTVFYTPVMFWILFGCYIAWYYISGITLLIEEAKNRKKIEKERMGRQ
jgi:hypothetical protein